MYWNDSFITQASNTYFASVSVAVYWRDAFIGRTIGGVNEIPHFDTAEWEDCLGMKHETVIRKWFEVRMRLCDVNLDVFKLYFALGKDGEIITEGTQYYLVVSEGVGEDLSRFSYKLVLEPPVDSNLKKIIYPHAYVKPTGEVVYRIGEQLVYPVTFVCLPVGGIVRKMAI